MFKVIAECIDARTGKRFFKGDIFKPDPEEEQAERLIKAGCLKKVEGKEAETEEAKKATGSSEEPSSQEDAKSHEHRRGGRR